MEKFWTDPGLLDVGITPVMTPYQQRFDVYGTCRLPIPDVTHIFTETIFATLQCDALSPG